MKHMSAAAVIAYGFLALLLTFTLAVFRDAPVAAVTATSAAGLAYVFQMVDFAASDDERDPDNLGLYESDPSSSLIWLLLAVVLLVVASIALSALGV